MSTSGCDKFPKIPKISNKGVNLSCPQTPHRRTYRGQSH